MSRCVIGDYLGLAHETVSRAFGRLAEEGLIRTARDPQGFAEAVLRALTDPPEEKERRLARARGHDWGARMETLCASVGRALGYFGARTDMQRIGLPAS